MGDVAKTLLTLALGGLGLLASTGAALAMLHRWAWSPFVAADERRAKALDDAALKPVLERLEDIEVFVTDIRHEVNHNNGKSLKDVVTRIGQDVAVLAARFEDHISKEK